jgi:undecaprenyl-diphosphatase
MDIILLLKAVLMGLIEGATEFLPVSSTGHLIVTASLINFWTPEKRHVFEVAIQLGRDFGRVLSISPTLNRCYSRLC